MGQMMIMINDLMNILQEKSPEKRYSVQRKVFMAYMNRTNKQILIEVNVNAGMVE